MINLTDNNTKIMADHEILSHLQWYIDAGVDETIAENTLDCFSLAPQKPVIRQSPIADQRLVTPKSLIIPVEQIIREAEQLTAKCTTLDELKDTISSFKSCSLKKTATNTVFSDGNPESLIMLIGEAPGKDEDRYGKSCIGENGQFLDRMFKAIDLNREEHFYITNIIPWRPPGNRKPTSEEIAICLPFIKRHIELFNPALIILLGGISAASLLKSGDSIARLRGKWKEYQLKDNPVPARALYHPAYLLQQPKAKRDAWHDLLEIKTRIGELGL